MSMPSPSNAREPPERTARTPPPPSSARDRKLQALEASNATLEQQLAGLQAEHAAVVSKLSNPDAHETVGRHIRLLHDYNEVRDVGLGLLGLIAESRQVRVQDVMPEFGLKPTD